MVLGVTAATHWLVWMCLWAGLVVDSAALFVVVIVIVIVIQRSQIFRKDTGIFIQDELDLSASFFLVSSYTLVRRLPALALALAKVFAIHSLQPLSLPPS